MNRYSYSGPVMEYGTLVQEEWKGETMAISERKARTNLAFQWKKKNNRIAGIPISLPGNLRMIGGSAMR